MFTQCLTNVASPSTVIASSPVSDCFTGGMDSGTINTFSPEYWDNNSCTYSVIEQASSSGLGVVQDASRSLLSWGLSLSPNAPTANDVRRIILDLCTSSSLEVCGSFLQEACVCNNPSQLASELEMRLCGCYSSQRDGSSSSIVPPQCSPFCAQPGIVAQSGVACDPQVVCIIDDISVNAQFSSQGNTSLVQRCGGCAQVGTCRCVIDIDSKVSSLVNVDQACGSGSVCFSRGENGVIKETGCSSSSSVNGISSSFFANPLLWIPIVAIIICLTCLGILAAV